MVGWTCEEERIRRKKYSGDGATWDKKKWKTKAEMDGLCQPRHESYRNNKLEDDVHDRTGRRLRNHVIINTPPMLLRLRLSQ